MTRSDYQAVIIGVSSGGMEALSVLLPKLPKNFPWPVIVVSHRLQMPDTFLTTYLDNLCQMKVEDAEHLEAIQKGIIYIAPPAYHLLIAEDHTFNLTVDPAVNASRPSIDVTFETAAEVYGKHLIGIVLTGANSDGAAGLKKIKAAQGYTIVQDPKTARATAMPTAAIASSKVDYINSIPNIAQHLCDLAGVEVVHDK